MRTADSTMASAETVAAARLLLSQMGISPADLVAESTAPTFGEVVPKVRTTLTPGTLRTYDTPPLSWFEDQWGA